MTSPSTPPPLEDRIRERPKRPDSDWRTTWQLGLVALAVIGLWGLALLFAGLGLVQFFSLSRVTTDVISLSMMGAGLAFTGVLLLPSIVYAYAHLRRVPISLPPRMPPRWLPQVALLTPLIVLLGHWVSDLPWLAWLLLPPFHILALGLPILWLLWFGRRGLSRLTPRRVWGSFGAGMVLAPALILALEIFAVIALLVFAGLFLSTRPDLLQDITQMAEQLSRSNLTPERIGRTVEPYLMNPKIGFTVLAFFAGLVPLIEELLKPIGVWLLIGGDMTPAEGFALGLLSGAGYALFENLALSSQAEAWAFAVTARAGTSLLHMLTSALFGWGIVHARRENTYLRLVLTYLTAMLIHGLWNGLSLFALVSTLDIPSSNVIFTLIQPLGRIAPAGLIALTLMSFAILASGNYLLREKLPSADRPAVPPKPAISADLTSEGGSG